MARKKKKSVSKQPKPPVQRPRAFFAVVALGATVLVYCSSREHMNERPIIDLGSEPRVVAPRGEPADELPVLDFKNSFFEFNKSTLRPEAQKVLRESADWLKRNGKVLVQIEGFCDDRGSEQYNLVLGEKRANAVLEFFVAHGIDRSRLTAISYGRMQGARKDIRAQNRRVGIVAIYPSE